MYLSCSCLVCDPQTYPTLTSALAEIRELGFAAFDLDAFENWQHVSPSALVAEGEAAVARVAEVLRDSGLRPASFNCSPSRPLTDAAAEAFAQYGREFHALLDLADRVRCPNLTVQPGRLQEGQELDVALCTMADHLSALADSASERGVSVGVEAHQGSILEDPQASLRTIEKLWPVVGLTYDPSHFAMQEIDLSDTEALLDYTVHVHVRNAAPGKMQETFSDGTVDFAWLIAALDRREYTGAVTIEYFSAFDAQFESTRALRRRLLDLGVRAE